MLALSIPPSLSSKLARFKAAVELHKVKHMILHLHRILRRRLPHRRHRCVDSLEGPAVDVEFSVEDDFGTEGFFERFRKVFKKARRKGNAVAGLEMTTLKKCSYTIQLRLNVTRVTYPVRFIYMCE